MKIDVYGVYEVRKYLKTIDADEEDSMLDSDFDWPDLENLDNCTIELDYIITKKVEKA